MRRFGYLKRVLAAGAAALGLSGLLSASVLAQTGEISGSLGGQSFQYNLSGEPMGFPGAMMDFASDGATAELDVIMFGLEPEGKEVKGAMVFVAVETEGDYQLEDLQADMPFSVMIMLADKWVADEADPRTAWIAESDEASSVSIDRLDLTEEGGSIAGRLVSDKFCLHDSANGKDEPVLKNGEPVCQSGEVAFQVDIGDAQAMAAQPGPDRNVEVDVLGQLEGTVGDNHYQWMTILPKGSDQGSATFSEISGKPAGISLQGYSPEAGNFLSQDVMSISILSKHIDGFRLNEPMDADVTFMVDGSKLIYSGQDGEGGAQAIVRDFKIDGDLATVTLEVSGRLCRVEQFKLIADDCLPFAVSGQSELMLE
ncbi:hypothetical protein DBV39_01360 [Orrella marina]|uniref:Uncharacterized protein n=1 Tax=Orrella marina TaxID=2163011 RepID=A0A2R4XFJ7_9BURK|nr:hypothetical protein DBV39_01360 [Orrella marina]